MNTKNKKKIEKNQLNISIQDINFRDIEEAEINPQEMNDKDFKRLINNLKRDGVLTSTPLIMRQPEKSKYRCVSGHHRIKAAIAAGILNGSCMIIDEVPESTRTRLQLAHNDIHGEPNKDLVSILSDKLDGIDLKLVDSEGLEDRIKELQDNFEYTPPKFRYINICLLEESRDSLIEIIENFGNTEDINWLIEKEQYENITDLLSLAFKKGFRSPGQAFGKFLEIIQENKNLIER